MVKNPNLNTTSVDNTVDLLKALLSISRQRGIEAIAYEACKQIVDMLGIFTVSFAVVNQEQHTGHLITEYIREERETDPIWFQPLDYSKLPIFSHVIENQEIFHFHKNDPEISNSPEMEIFKDFVAQQIVLVPVLTRDGIFGMLLLWERSATRVFSESDFTFLELLANTIGIIEEKTQLLLKSEQRTKELEDLHDFAESLSSSQNLEDVLTATVEGLYRILPEVLYVNVILSMAGKAETRYPHCYSIDQAGYCSEGNEWAKEVLRTGSPLIIKDTQISDPDGNCLNSKRPCALVALPLRAMSQMLGVLQIVYQHPRDFSTQSIHNLEMLVDRAAVAIRNRLLLEEITNQAMTDSLTGLANRRAFQQELQKEIARTNRNNSEFCLLFIDLDGFKQINDKLGHPEGDKTLQKVAHCFLESTRGSDLVARLGGDEFVILLPDTGAAGGGKVATLIQSRFDHCSFEWKKQFQDVAFGVSIGVVQFPDQADTIEKLYQLGDELLYHDKAREK